MSRGQGRGLWLSDPFFEDGSTDAERQQEMAYLLENWDFWSYVDSDTTFRGHPGECRPHPSIPEARIWNNGGSDYYCNDYRHRRDSTYCMAAKSSHEQCGQFSHLGLPFCNFHMDRAWRYIAAALDVARQEHINQRVKWRLEGAVEMTLAEIADAKSQLLKSNERVYFFLADTALKIGRSIHPEKRVRTLSGTKAPEGIAVDTGKLIGTIPGGARVESTLHHRFRPHRLVGEWFEYEPIAIDIAELLIESSKAGAA